MKYISDAEPVEPQPPPPQARWTSKPPPGEEEPNPFDKVEPWSGWSDWQSGLQEKNRQTIYPIAGENAQLSSLPIGPGMLTAIGAPPGEGKTMLAMQSVVNALFADEELTAIVANVDMTPEELLDRQVSRLAQVPMGAVWQRCYTAAQRENALEAGADLVGLRSRLHFMQSPWTVTRLTCMVERFGADIVVVDYLQHFHPAGGGSDFRMRVSDTITELRDLARSGPAVVAITALSRQGAYRESSEIEYACDACYRILRDESTGETKLHCDKNRFGPLSHIPVVVNGALQEVTSPEIECEQAPTPEPFEEFAAYGGDY